MKWIALLGMLATSAFITGCEDDEVEFDDQVEATTEETFDNIEEAGEEAGDELQAAGDEMEEGLEEAGDRITAADE